MTSASLDVPPSSSFLLSPTREFYWRIGETYSQAVSRHLSEQRRAEHERTLAAYIHDINVVNSFYGVPQIGKPPEPPPEPGRRWELAEAYQAAVASGVQPSGRIVEDVAETFVEHSTVEDAPVVSVPPADATAAAVQTSQASAAPPAPKFGRLIVFVDACRLVMGGVSKRTTEPKVRKYFADRGLIVCAPPDVVPLPSHE